jgi:hypothetical protein
MGAKMFDVGGNPLMMFPGVYINLNLGQEKGEGGTVGSVVNHVGFIVNNVQEQVAKWKAAGVPVLPGTNNRPDQAFVVTPGDFIYRRRRSSYVFCSAGGQFWPDSKSAGCEPLGSLCEADQSYRSRSRQAREEKCRRRVKAGSGFLKHVGASELRI